MKHSEHQPWIWHDGGRAASGFVGQAGDCVTRSIAIATGEAYRDVYNRLGKLAERSPRQGFSCELLRSYLEQHGWRPNTPPQSAADLPRGVVLIEFRHVDQRRLGHLSCMVDHTTYDTWNPLDDGAFQIETFWTFSSSGSDSTLPQRTPGIRQQTDAAKLTQHEYERILKRVKALQRTASNEASTEGEIRNALRAMQALMLQHNLSRNDLADDTQVGKMGMTRRACALNGRRACYWEIALANYVTKEVFSTVQFYIVKRGPRRLIWLYGPVDDVDQALGIFQELLLTIATSARLKYRGYSRGSGASYAEGYVLGLPRTTSPKPEATSCQGSNDRALVQARALAVHTAAVEWLHTECYVRLRTDERTSGRYHFDPLAHRQGTIDGATHEAPSRHKRIGWQA